MTPSFTEVRKILIVSVILVYSVRCAPIEEDSGVTAGDFAFDWRDRGVISPVRDQDKPHYWDPFTIALTEGMETLLALQTGQPAPELSGWEVADCCVNVYHQSIYPGYNCFISTGGLCTQATYNSSRGKCENDTCQAVVKVTKSEFIATGREDLMVDIIHKVPLTALIDASRPSFTKYVGGIYSEPTCSSTVSNHVVQVVGYGTATGVDYWIIKNCWGTGWGEQGYMRIARGKNMCGIGANAFYPISQQ